MKRVKALFLLIVLLTGSLPILHASHFCDGHFVQAQLQMVFGTPVSCGMEEDECDYQDENQATFDDSKQNVNALFPHIEEKSCCENQIDVYQSQGIFYQDYATSSVQLLSFLAHPIDTFEYQLSVVAEAYTKIIRPLTVYSGRSLLVLYQTFLI